MGKRLSLSAMHRSKRRSWPSKHSSRKQRRRLGRRRPSVGRSALHRTQPSRAVRQSRKHEWEDILLEMSSEARPVMSRCLVFVVLSWDSTQQFHYNEGFVRMVTIAVPELTAHRGGELLQMPITGAI